MHRWCKEASGEGDQHLGNLPDRIRSRGGEGAMSATTYVQSFLPCLVCEAET